MGKRRARNHSSLAERYPPASALADSRRPAFYQAGKMVQVQGEQMGRKDMLQYLAEKYDIKTGVEASGQGNLN